MLRGAFLGAGNIALQGHVPAYLSSPEVARRCQIVAAADLCDENLSRAAQLIPGLRTFRSTADLLAEIRPDFVDICAPPYVHREFIDQAVDHGCHIICEKPLSLTLADAEKIAESLAGTPLVFMPGHQYHYAPVWRAVRGALLAGSIGQPRFGVVSIQRQRASDGNPYWQPAWRTTEALSGGGILMDHGTHLFYQLGSVFGRPRQIGAHIGTRRHVGYGVEDTACCYVEYAETLVRVSLTWAAPKRQTHHWYQGSEGTLQSNESEVRISTRAGVDSEHFADGFSKDSSHAEWYTPLFLDFLSRVERADYGRELLDESFNAIRCAAAAYDAARSGRPVIF